MSGPTANDYKKFTKEQLFKLVCEHKNRKFQCELGVVS